MTDGAALTRPSGIIDAHTHIFPPDVIAGRERYVGRDLWFEHLYTNPKALLIGADELTASMDTAGIAVSVAAGFPWHDAGICREHNDFMAEASLGSGGRIAWLGIVSPSDPTATEEADRCFRLGASGIGEFNADAQRFDWRDTALLAPIVDVCRSWGRPVMVHASEPLGHDYPGKGTATPEKLLAFLSAFPDQPAVLAHWGGGLPFFELMPEIAQTTRSTWYDTAASTYLYRFEVFRSVLDVVGPERVLWGSDYPVLRQDRFLARTLAANLKPAEIEPLLRDNAARVYGIPVAKGESQ